MIPILAGEHFFAYHDERGIVFGCNAQTEAECWDILVECYDQFGAWFEGDNKEEKLKNAENCGWLVVPLFFMTHGVLGSLLDEKNGFIELLQRERKATWHAAREMHGGIVFSAEKPQVYERYAFQTLEDWEKSRNE